VLQLLLSVAAVAAALSPRLGPARIEPPERQRSTLEYLHSFAWLVRRAHVERELVPELDQAFRRLLSEKVGLSTDLDDREVGRELSARWHVPPGEYEELAARARALAADERVAPAAYARLARDFARLEQQVGAA